MWPREGHFNNGAWEEATKHRDDSTQGGMQSVDLTGCFIFSEQGFGPLLQTRACARAMMMMMMMQHV